MQRPLFSKCPRERLGMTWLEAKEIDGAIRQDMCLNLIMVLRHGEFVGRGCHSKRHSILVTDT